IRTTASFGSPTNPLAEILRMQHPSRAGNTDVTRDAVRGPARRTRVRLELRLEPGIRRPAEADCSVEGLKLASTQVYQGLAVGKRRSGRQMAMESGTQHT